jgi:hypothetical protein
MEEAYLIYYNEVFTIALVEKVIRFVKAERERGQWGFVNGSRAFFDRLAFIRGKGFEVGY